jgi:hypothetical protein
VCYARRPGADVTRIIVKLSQIALVAFVTPLVLWPWIVRLPPGGIEDDGYFYASIAYHAGVDGAFSFDGIHRTDGFHMLWGYVLAGGSFLLSMVTHSRNAHLYLACVISIGVIAVVADRFGHHYRDKVLLLGLGLSGTLLMETPLLALLVLSMVLGQRSLHRAAKSGWAPYVLLPMAITATRVDATVISAVWAICLALAHRGRLAVLVAIGIVLGGLVHLGLNLYTAGEWISVAAVLKTERSLSSLARGNLWPTNYLGRNLLLVLLLITSSLAVWRQMRTTGDRQWLFAWLAMASFTVPHFFATMRPWYFVPGYLGCTALLIAIRDAGSPSAVRAARTGLVAGWIGLAAFLFIEVRAGMRYANETQAIRDFLTDVRRIVPEGEPIYQVDGSGYIGFFSERPIVNGDGLVNTHRYAERMKAGQLAGYLDEEGISFIITNRADLTHVVDHGGLVVPLDAAEQLAQKQGPVVNRFTNFRLFRRK